MERGWILAVERLDGTIDLPALEGALAEEGLKLELHAGGASDRAGMEGAFAARPPRLVMLGQPPGQEELALATAALASDIPVLAIGQSWFAGRLRLDESAPAGASVPRPRLRRLWQARFETLTEELVHAAHVGAGLAASGEAPGPQDVLIDWRGRPPHADCASVCSGGAVPPDEEWLEAIRRSRFAGALRTGAPPGSRPIPDAAVVCVVGDHPDGLTALAGGREVIVCGRASYSELGVAYEAGTPDELTEAVAAVLERGERRNNRDRSRRLLATEILFGSVANDPAALAAAIAEAGDALAAPRVSVSIVINNYNYRRYLTDAIDSAKAQTVPACEVVVVDDGSTDGSAELLRQTGGIVPVLKPNGGQASAFNAGFKQATGDVIVFLDADDRLHPHAVERIRAAWRPGLSRLQFGLETIDAAGGSIGLYPGSRSNSGGDLFGAVLARGIYRFIPTSGNAFSREALARVLPMNEREWRIKADLYLALATPATGPIVHLPEMLGQYRVHGRNAHYHPLGWKRYRLPQSLRDRVVAWSDLIAGLHGMATDEAVDLWRLRLHRRLCLARSEGAGSTFRRRLGAAMRAFWLAATVRSVPLRLRAAHAMLPLKLALSRLLRREHGLGSHNGVLAWPWPDAPMSDFLSHGGASTWPRLDHGSVVAITPGDRDTAVLGWGWDWPGRAGARLKQACATLAFTLPGPPANWRLELDLAVETGETAVEVELDLNGAPLELVTIRQLRRVTLHVPDELLGPRLHGDLACCLLLRVPEGETPVRLSRLAVYSAPFGATRPVTFLPSEQSLVLRAGEPTVAILGKGWHWPDKAGARMSAPEAQLAFATREVDGEIVLRLQLDCRTGAGRAIAPDLLVDGQPIEAHLALDGRSVTAVLDAGTLRDDGIIELDIVAHEDPMTGAWPAMHLGAIRIGNLQAPGRRRGLVPDKWHRIGDIAAHGGIEVEHLVPTSGAVARIAGRSFGLTFRPATSSADLRLTLFLTYLGADAPEPVAGTVTVNDISTRVLLGGMNRVTVPLHLPDHSDVEPLVTARFEADTDDHNLGLAWFAVGEGAARASRPPLPVPAGQALELDADALYQHVLDETDWHPPSEGALWLSSQRGALHLPFEPAGERTLVVTVMSIPGSRQTLTLEFGDHSVVAEGSGLQTLYIPLPSGADGSRDSPCILTLAADHLISLEALGGDADSPVVGGAIVSIAVVESDADVAERALPGERRQLDEIADLIEVATNSLANPGGQGGEPLPKLRAVMADAVWAADPRVLHELCTRPNGLQTLERLGAFTSVTPLAPPEQTIAVQIAAPAAADTGNDDRLRIVLAGMLLLPASEMSPAPRLESLPSPVLADPDSLAAWFTRQPLFIAEARITAHVRYLEELLDSIESILTREDRESDRYRLAVRVLLNLHTTAAMFGSDPLTEVIRRRSRCIELYLAQEGHALDMPRDERQGAERLRLGVLVRDVLTNPEGWALLGMYRCLDRARFEPILIRLDRSDTSLDTGDRFEREICLQDLSVAEAVAKIRGLDLDLLVVGAYTSGWDTLSALVAHRLAPVQLLRPVYPTTSGFSNVDYALTCRAIEPDDADTHYTETLAWIEGPLQCCYEFAGVAAPSAEQPQSVRKELGVPEDAVVLTSGAMAYKLLPELIACWSTILARVPGAILVLYPFARNWHAFYPESDFRGRLKSQASSNGVAEDRLILLEEQSPEQVRRILSASDLYLDSFPYSGATTVCEALSCGAPVIARAGSTLRGLTGAAWLRAYGLDELVADSADDYVATAVRVAANPAERQELGRRIAANLRDGRPPHFNPEVFGAAYSEGLWRLARDSGRFPRLGEARPDARD